MGQTPMVVGLCRKLLPHVSDQHAKFVAVLSNHQTKTSRLKLRDMLFVINGNNGSFVRIGDEAVTCSHDVLEKSRRLWRHKNVKKDPREDTQLLIDQLNDAKYIRDVSKFRYRSQMLSKYIREMLAQGAFMYK